MLAMVAALLLAFLAIAARAAEPPAIILLAANACDVHGDGSDVHVDRLTPPPGRRLVRIPHDLPLAARRWLCAAPDGRAG